KEPKLCAEEYIRRFPQFQAEIQSRWSAGIHSAQTVNHTSDSVANSTLPPGAIRSGTHGSTKRSTSGTLPIHPGYEILAESSRRGMGVVYKALDLKRKRLVAVKMILVGAHAGKQEIRRGKLGSVRFCILHFAFLHRWPIERRRQY